jgi:putative hydrolase of the HAD superfamily
MTKDNDKDTQIIVAPKGLLLDYGGTLVVEDGLDPGAGHELLLTRTAHLPEPIGLEQVMDRANRLTAEVYLRRGESQLETPWQTVSRLVYDYLDIRFADPMADLEMAYWKASVTTRPMPGAREALEALQRDGMRMGVVSNCQFGQEVLRYELGKYGLADNLRFIMVSAEYSVRKPNVLLFDTAAAKLGIASKDIWFVGDRLDTDIAGAKAAGMTAVLFDPGNCQSRENADLKVESWEQLVQCYRDASSLGSN